MAVVPLVTQLLNVSSKAMNVNGSSTNQVFSYSPGSNVNGNNNAELLSLSILLESTGTDAFNKFGKLTALANGLSVDLSVGGTSYNICLIKDNSDLVTMFPDNNFGSSAQGTLGGAVGFGASVGVFTGKMILNDTSLVLNGTDSITVTVKDALSSLGTLVCTISALFQSA